MNIFINETYILCYKNFALKFVTIQVFNNSQLSIMLAYY